jgi:hypothetical protein
LDRSDHRAGTAAADDQRIGPLALLHPPDHRIEQAIRRVLRTWSTQAMKDTGYAVEPYEIIGTGNRSLDHVKVFKMACGWYCILAQAHPYDQLAAGPLVSGQEIRINTRLPIFVHNNPYDVRYTTKYAYQRAGPAGLSS